jgi:hypothetical protein
VIAAVVLLVVITIAIAALRLAPEVAAPELVLDRRPDTPAAFGYRMAWLAIRTRDTQRVLRALGLEAAEPSGWQTGIGIIYDRRHGENRLFVSPPVNGWTFVVGHALPHPVGRGFVDKCTPLLLALGKEFIEVQYFFTFPPIDHHAWARVVDGRIVRAFAINDEGIFWNKGRPTKEEKTLGLKLFELRGVRGRKGDAGGELILYPTEEHVMRLAGRWSLDPTQLDKSGAAPAVGYCAWAPASWASERLRKAG